jgi:formyltetrahydrofolate deformylase
MAKKVLLIECKDEKGIIYKVSKILFENNLNIQSNSEFVDNENNKFFMRTEIIGEFDAKKILKELKNALPKSANILLNDNKKKNIVVLVTKEHHAIGDLLVRNEFNDVNARIQSVIGNYDILKPLVEKFNIPYHFISHENLTRKEHEQNIIHLLEKYNPDFIVLAKYMRILSPEFVQKFKNKIINIHHSFLPAFVGAKPYKQAFDRGVKIIGATAHFVNNNLDEGPIIAQDVISVDHSDNALKMATLGKDVEKIVLARALKLVFEDRVFVNGNKTVIFD